MLLSEIYLIIISIITLISTNSSRELERKTSSFFFSFPNINEKTFHILHVLRNPLKIKNKTSISCFLFIYWKKNERHKTDLVSISTNCATPCCMEFVTRPCWISKREKKTFEWLEITRWSHQRL